MTRKRPVSICVLGSSHLCCKTSNYCYFSKMRDAGDLPTMTCGSRWENWRIITWTKRYWLALRALSGLPAVPDRLYVFTSDLMVERGSHRWRGLLYVSRKPNWASTTSAVAPT